MNILYYLKNYPKLSQSFVLNEIVELDRRGHNVAVFARQNPGEEIQHQEYSQLEIPVRYAAQPTPRDLPDLLDPVILNARVLRQVLYRTTPKNHARYLHLTRQCIEYIRNLDWEPDIIHCHFAHPNKFPATYTAKYFEIPCTVAAHAYEIFRNPDIRLLNALLNRMDRVIAPSQYNREYLRKQLQVKLPIEVVPATTRVSKYDPTHQEIPGRILTIARLVEKKGIEYAIEALGQLSETYPDVEYHIVGTGEQKEALRNQVRDLGVEDRVVFLGHVDDSRLHQELDEASVFVLPCVIASDGDRDAMPVVLKEAMAMETPCVSTTVSAIPELIEHEKNGLLVEPRDSVALADGVSKLLSDDDMRETMGHRARETVQQNFSLEAAGDSIVTAFENTIESYQK
ncbi:glycosyltransferase family 4 protein [Halococcus salsus]|uniref:glycosyltransferase family 4 protein n=1 Tax=Halococcus salsus TaxID=2162894 RepID=UPI00135C4688|nr:glycosyltransferase family 4 protein [Halococcus salsus]